jgi:hypothetical protein
VAGRPGFGIPELDHGGEIIERREPECYHRSMFAPTPSHYARDVGAGRGAKVRSSIQAMTAFS